MLKPVINSALVAIPLTISGHVFADQPNISSASHNAIDPYLSSAKQQWQRLETYCMDCHNATDWSGKIAFDTMFPEDVPKDAEIWERAIRKLRGRQMPPAGEMRPDENTYDEMIAWLEGYIDDAAANHPQPGHVAIHRLNRKEFSNAIEDLLALQVNADELLPQDDQADGFDNVANVLQVSPSFFNQYISAARQVAVEAVGNANPGPGSKAYFLPADGEGAQTFHVDGLPLGTRGGFAVEHYFPADGEYIVNVMDMFQDIYFLGVEFKNTLIVTLDGKEVYRTVLGGESDLKWIDQDQSPATDAINARVKNIRFQATAGPHQVAVTFLARTFAESDSRLSQFVPGGGMDRLMRVLGFEVRGPFNPTGLSTTPSRQRIFSCYPNSTKEELPCAKQILENLAHHAYRRPITDTDLNTLLTFYQNGYASADAETSAFEEGIRSGLTRILASPNFLYRTALPSDNDFVADSIFQLDDGELATRLAFFLWSGPPDQELLNLAETGRLHDPKILNAQVQRLLADPKSATLASNFAFQWLKLAKLAEIDPDPNVFPFAANHRSLVAVDGELRDEMREEVKLFVDSVFREDQSVLNLLTADYTYLNERLALHYGIRNIKGARFRRHTLDDSRRWGLFGKAAVLMSTSYPDRTAPVLRGAWILENIMGTPPAAPPSDVEALLKDNEVGTKEFKTVRERLAQHRVEPRCNGCHGIMDPLGFALENFDAVGRWRDVELFAGTPIDSTGELPDGMQLSGPDDLRTALMRRPDQFVQTLTENLMIYALGRTLEYQDMPTIRQIVRDAAAQDYRFSAIVMGIVNSNLFQMEEVQSRVSSL